jgi:hypothetical protein
LNSLQNGDFEKVESAEKLAALDRVAARFGPSQLVDELRRRLRSELERERADRPRRPYTRSRRA